MTLKEIKTAVDSGKKVIWCNPGYEVQKDKNGQYLIVYLPNGNCTGLTHKDGVTLNGKENEFSIVPEMTNYILINRTYSEATPESSKDGSFSDIGLIEQNERVTFKELVELMKAHPQCSASGQPGGNYWFSTTWYIKDYRTGTEREESIHFSKDNAPNVEKYWIKAATFAAKWRKKLNARQ